MNFVNNTIDMDCLQEAIILGIDVIIFGFCLRSYRNYKNTVGALKEAPQLNIDKDLIEYVASRKDGKVPYAVVRGTVTPMGTPLKSVKSSVSGVLQVIKVYEHRVRRGIAGFWTENRKLFYVSTSEVPFQIANNNVGIEVIDPLSADILDLDVVHDSYEPVSLSFFDQVFGFFTGIRQRGIQTTEEILRDGNIITAIGQIELDGGDLKLQESTVGPMFLTTATKSLLIRRFEQARNGMLFKVIVCGTIAMITTAMILRKIYLRRKRERSRRKSSSQRQSEDDDEEVVVVFKVQKR